MNYYWNAFFYLINQAFNCIDTDNLPILSSQMFSLMEYKLEELSKTLFENYTDAIENIGNINDIQSASIVASIHFSKMFASNIKHIIEFKFPKLYRKHSKWDRIVEQFDELFKNYLFVYTKSAFLDVIPKMLGSNADTYMNQEGKFPISEPTLNCVRMIKVLQNIDTKYEFLVGMHCRQRILYSIITQGIDFMEFCLKY